MVHALRLGSQSTQLLGSAFSSRVGLYGDQPRAHSLVAPLSDESTHVFLQNDGRSFLGQRAIFLSLEHLSRVILNGTDGRANFLVFFALNKPADGRLQDAGRFVLPQLSHQTTRQPPTAVPLHEQRGLPDVLVSLLGNPSAHELLNDDAARAETI